MNALILKTFNDSGCFAHLVGDPQSREALLIDGKAGKRAVYERALKDYDLKLAGVVDTHTHADHLSDSAAWVKLGLPLYMGAATGCARKHVGLEEGSKVALGALTFTAFEVPGHTSDSIALYWNGGQNGGGSGGGNGAGPGVVFAGDTLFAGSLARADFRGSNPERLFESVQSKLMKLPNSTVVLSGHGYQDVLFTTIGHERAHNPALHHPHAAAYASSLNAVEGRGNSPEVDVMLATNLAADPKLPEGALVVAACCSMGGAPIAGARIREQRCDELALRRADLVAKRAWIDVRDPWEWKAGHIPGVPNFPLSELGLHLDEVRKLAPQVISCKSGGRSMTAAKTLTYLGVLHDPISMTGGFGTWEEMRLPVEK
jgi:glyoxylase-like metal-dependent hydrolase (beta-lactamase superfamily II)/rhodanese-related sulfurtransferase